MTSLTWRIVPQHTPRVLRRCPRCEGVRTFESSDKFRINASGRKLDVWLIYKCRVCKQTWNADIYSRVNPESLDPELYQNFLSNDRDTAWRCAFDYEQLKKNQAELDPKVEYVVEGERLDLRSHTGEARVHIALVHPLNVRLETLLAHQLGISRSKLEELHESGAVRVEPEMKLNKKLKQDVVVTVCVDALRS